MYLMSWFPFVFDNGILPNSMCFLRCNMFMVACWLGFFRTQHEQVAEPDSQSSPLKWQVTFIGVFLVCNLTTFRCGKTNSTWSEGWAAVSSQWDLLVFVKCCFAGMKITFFLLTLQQVKTGDFKSWRVIFLLCRTKETSVGHPKGDGVGTDGLSSLSGLPRRFRWTHSCIMLSS